MRFFASFFFALFFCTAQLSAHHGAGSSATVLIPTGYLLPEGTMELSLSADFQSLRDWNKDEVKARTLAKTGGHAHVDVLTSRFRGSFGLNFGLLEAWQLGVSTSFVRDENAREGHVHGNGSYGFHEFGNISGLGDTWVHNKVKAGPVALLAGLKIPTGRDDVPDGGVSVDGTADTTGAVSARGHLSLMGPGHQPGTGSVDGMLGLAWSGHLADALSLDASAGYLINGAYHGFKASNRLEAGANLAWRALGQEDGRRKAWLMLAVQASHSTWSEEEGALNWDSGGTFVGLAPGLKLGLNPHDWVVVAWQMPLLQSLNGTQQELSSRLVASLGHQF